MGLDKQVDFRASVPRKGNRFNRLKPRPAKRSFTDVCLSDGSDKLVHFSRSRVVLMRCLLRIVEELILNLIRTNEKRVGGLFHPLDHDQTRFALGLVKPGVESQCPA